MEEENTAVRDYGMQGDILIAVAQMIDQSRKEMHMEISAAFGTLRRDIESIAQRKPDHLDTIEQYLHLLYEAQKVDHNVHKEIEEALAQFKRGTII